jgi:hypothetical protein
MPPLKRAGIGAFTVSRAQSVRVLVLAWLPLTFVSAFCLRRRLADLRFDSLTRGFMLGPGPENTALLNHAGTIAGIPCNGVRALTPRQTGRFSVLVLLLNLGVSFAALAVGAPPKRGIIFGHAAV